MYSFHDFSTFLFLDFEVEIKGLRADFRGLCYNAEKEFYDEERNALPIDGFDVCSFAAGIL